MGGYPKPHTGAAAVSGTIANMAKSVGDPDPDRLERLSLELERNRAEVERLTMLAAAARERMVQARERMRKLQREVAEAVNGLPSGANVQRPRAS